MAKERRSSKRITARRVDELAAIKTQISDLRAREEELVDILKAQGGGESASWLADIVRMPKRTMVVKAHRQLRLYAKS